MLWFTQRLRPRAHNAVSMMSWKLPLCHQQVQKVAALTAAAAAAAELPQLPAMVALKVVLTAAVAVTVQTLEETDHLSSGRGSAE